MPAVKHNSSAAFSRTAFVPPLIWIFGSASVAGTVVAGGVSSGVDVECVLFDTGVPFSSIHAR